MSNGYGPIKTTPKASMAAFDQLDPRLRHLINYAPDKFSPEQALFYQRLCGADFVIFSARQKFAREYPNWRFPACPKD